MTKQEDGYYKQRQDNLSSISKFLKSLTTDFSQTINILSEKHSNAKNELVKMEEDLRKMMIVDKTTKGCQVNELELKWGVENVANLDVIQNEFYDNSIKLKGAGISFDTKSKKIKPNDNTEKLEIESEEKLKAKVMIAESRFLGQIMRE